MTESRGEQRIADGERHARAHLGSAPNLSLSAVRRPLLTISASSEVQLDEDYREDRIGEDHEEDGLHDRDRRQAPEFAR